MTRGDDKKGGQRMDLNEVKAQQRTTWETGDYRPIGRLLDPAAQKLVGRAGVATGQRVLDVGGLG